MPMNAQRFRLAALVSHPIQYQAPLFRTLARHPRIDLTVLFASDQGHRAYRDEGFGREVCWDQPLLEGYRHQFLRNLSLQPGVSRFGGLLNPGIVRALIGGRYDAIWIHGWAHATEWLAILAASVLRLPVLLRGEANLLSEGGPRARVWKRRLLAALFQHISACLAIGRANADFYRSYGVPEQKIFSVPYAVDNTRFFQEAARHRLRRNELKQEWGIPLELPIVLFSGKFTPAKRPMDLLQACEIVGLGRRVALLFVGDGALRPELEAYVRERRLSQVHFMGFKNQSELGPYFAAADLFVLPSAFEPWGLVVNEALCFGLPVVVSDRVGAGADLVKPGENGEIIPAGDVPALAASIERFAADPERRRIFGENSRRLIADFSYEKDVQGILACIQEVRLDLAG